MAPISAPIKSVPFSKLPHILREFSKGLYRETFGPRRIGEWDPLRIRVFFEGRSRAGSYQDFTESTTEWYLSGMDPEFLSSLLGASNRLIVDLGCGRGGLVNLLRSYGREFRYLGVDFDEVGIELCNVRLGCESVRFEVLDVLNLKLIDCLRLNGERPAVFAINLLPYVDDLAGFCQRLQELKPEYLIVVDPCPCPYWETSFGCFEIFVREPAVVVGALQASGFFLIGSCTLSGLVVCGIPFISISTTSIWKLNQ